MLEQLGRPLAEVDPAHMLSTLRGELRQDDGSLVQDTHALLAHALRTLGANSADLDVPPCDAPCAHPLFLGPSLCRRGRAPRWVPSFLPVLGQMEDLALLMLA